MIVVDSSVLVSFFRGTQTTAALCLRQLEQNEVPYAVPAICCQEVLQGTRHEREWRLLRAYLETQVLLAPVDAVHAHIEAARIYFDCRRKGITVRSAANPLISLAIWLWRGTSLRTPPGQGPTARC